VLVSPDSTATYEINPLDWIRAARDGGGARVVPALRAIDLPTLCIAGADEDAGACLDARATARAHVVRLPGSHHYRGDYARLGRTVRDFMAGARAAGGFAGPPR
jgi:type IV secretory pathway VirJ component